MQTWNGIGTSLWGSQKLTGYEMQHFSNQGISFQYDESFQPYYSTEWFSFIIPVIPIRSYIVAGEYNREGFNLGFIADQSVQYQLYRIPMNWNQVKKTYAGVLLAIFCLYIIFAWILPWVF